MSRSRLSLWSFRRVGAWPFQIGTAGRGLRPFARGNDQLAEPNQPEE